MTGTAALVRSQISASHDFHSGGPGLVGSGGAPDDGVGCVLPAGGFGSRAECSVGGEPPLGVTVWEEEVLDIFLTPGVQGVQRRAEW